MTNDSVTEAQTAQGGPETARPFLCHYPSCITTKEGNGKLRQFTSGTLREVRKSCAALTQHTGGNYFRPVIHSRPGFRVSEWQVMTAGDGTGGAGCPRRLLHSIFVRGIN